MSLIPAPWPVLHISRQIDYSVLDEHGNPKIVDLPGVIRYAVSLNQSARSLQRASTELYSVEYLQRVETAIHMVVQRRDIPFYRSSDRVLPSGTVIDGVYSGGVAFLVDGEVLDDTLGPWPSLYRAFGGMIRLRRSG